MATVIQQKESKITRGWSFSRWKFLRPVKSLFPTLFLIVGSFFFVAPLVYLLSTSLKASRQIAKFPPELIPNPFIWRNYSDVFIYAPMHQYFVNTLFIVIPAIFGAAITSALAVRVRSPARLGRTRFMALLATMMLLGVVTLIPTYILFAKLG
jgi:multiple sugar transport system permease protein